MPPRLPKKGKRRGTFINRLPKARQTPDIVRPVKPGKRGVSKKRERRA